MRRPVTSEQLRRLVQALALAAVPAAVALGCGRDVVVGMEEPRTTGLADAALDSPPGDASHVCHAVWCDERHLYDCGDCLDNDSDGKADMDDPDCLGPCQNTEETFNGAIPGQNHPACEQDCYFDQDSGSGNDHCAWTHRCDPLSVAPTYGPEGQACVYPSNDPQAQTTCTALALQPDECRTLCGPLTPNGCDCFGCCSIPGAPTPVWVGSTDDLDNATCDLAHVADPTRCRPCTQVTSCLNVCEHCELCVGKPTLPPDCPADGGCAVPVCDGEIPCSPCLPPCPYGYSCITGCCAAPLK